MECRPVESVFSNLFIGDPFVSLKSKYGESFAIQRRDERGGTVHFTVYDEPELRTPYYFKVGAADLMIAAVRDIKSASRLLEAKILQGIEEYFAYNGVIPVADRPHPAAPDDYLWRCSYCGGWSTDQKFVEYTPAGIARHEQRGSCQCCNAPRQEDGVIKPKENERLVKVSHTNPRYEYAMASYHSASTFSYLPRPDMRPMGQTVDEASLPSIRNMWGLFGRG